MSRRHARRNNRYVNAELNITAFMNLMVVLVPFLLITAVFSQITIIEMQLPKEGESSKAKEPPKKRLQLELIILPTAVVINDQQNGPLHVVNKTDKGYDFDRVNQLMYSIKQDNLTMNNITILSQEETTYETIVQAMDAVRYTKDSTAPDESQINTVLFPAISFGSAPEDYRLPRGN